MEKNKMTNPGERLLCEIYKNACRRQWYTGASSTSSIQKISVRSVPKSRLMAGPAMSGLWRISRWVRVVLGATCKKRSFQQPKIDA